MSIDTHIKFDGVEGESKHADHKNEIEMLSWSWGVQNAPSTHGGGMGVGKANPGDFSFTHLYDKSSPVLAKKCAQGVHFKEVVVTARKAGEGQKDFLKITMKEVFVTAVHPGGSSGGEINENVSLIYSDIGFEYKPQDDKGGLGGAVKFGWNVKTTTIT
jgi:type VI secretion system secreted protein Hcp